MAGAGADDRARRFDHLPSSAASMLPPYMMGAPQPREALMTRDISCAGTLGALGLVTTAFAQVRVGTTVSGSHSARSPALMAALPANAR
jgi:hypothetical protein